MNIAFLYIAEAYQCYHGAAIGLELAKRPGFRVTSYTNDPETPRHLARIAAAYDAPNPPCLPLRRSAPTRAMQKVRILGMFKDMALRDNAADLGRYDAIFAVENSVASLRRFGVRSPKLIYSPHGFGDRARGFIPRIAAFDYVLVAGVKTRDRMLREGLIRPGHYALTGSVKLETGERMRQQAGPLFARRRPIVFYNPHKAPDLSSWPRFIEPMLQAFSRQDEFNLLVAPHIKMFRRRSQRVRDRWEARGGGTVLIDTGSDRLLDMTYTAAADIYVGDASSQVYEFLAEPRPCVFLNAHGADWRGDPSYAHWHLGDVIDDPRQLMDAIRNAGARHAYYKPRQEELAQASLGDRTLGAATRAAEAIAGFLCR